MLISDPWFWAFIGVVGWLLGFLLIASKSLGQTPWLGIAAFLLAQVPRMILPLPFSRGVFVYGDPIVVPRESNPREMEEARVALERALNAVAERADREALR